MSGLLNALEGALPPDSLEGTAAGAHATVGGRSPEAVVAPGSEAEVRTLLDRASEAGVGVVPMGGRTSLGPEPPDGPFVALSTRRLAGITDYEPADLTITCGAGSTLGTLESSLAEHGQWLPEDPALAPRRTVGGVAATGARGGLATAFGAPRDHVLGLTLVTGDGRVLKLGGRVMKNVAGFDLVRLVVGSRGTMGVITSVSLRLFPRPGADRLLVLRGDDATELVEAARRVATARVVPAAATLCQGAPGVSTGAALVVRVVGAPAAVDADARTLLGDLLDRAEALEGAAAGPVLSGARDASAEVPLVVRAYALPAALPETLEALRTAGPFDVVAADVLTGRVRAGVSDAEAVDAWALTALRGALAAAGGTLVVERCAPALASRVPAYPDRGRAAGLTATLKASLDPGSVLSPGRFGA